MAQVALLGGLVSHSDGLIHSALGCLQSLDLMDGWFFFFVLFEALTCVGSCIITFISDGLLILVR